MALGYGSSGDDVRRLQEQLIAAGYNVGSSGADGKFGKNTQAAVTQYQRDKGLSVDGIAGSQTMGALNSGGGTQNTSPSGAVSWTNSTGPQSNAVLMSGQPNGPYGPVAENSFWVEDTPVKKKNSGKETYTESAMTKGYRDILSDVENASPGSYKESEAVRNALEYLNQVNGNKPGEFQSQYKGQIDSILQKILDTGDFDIKTDKNYGTLYDQYATMYRANADRAMKDAMGSAAALTGGYGSSYSQGAGQQAYDATMDQLNARNIELMNIAYQQYQDRINEQHRQLSTLQGLESTDYGRHRDDVGDWYNERNYALDRYNNERGIDYSRYRDTVGDWQDDRAYYQNALNNSFARDRSGYEYDNEFDYRAQRDARSDELDAFNKAMQYALNGAEVPSVYSRYLDDSTLADLARMKTDSLAADTGGSTGGGGSSGGYSKYEATFSEHFNKDKIKSSESINYSAANNIANAVSKGLISDSEGRKIANKYGVDFEKADKYEEKISKRELY